MTLCLSFWSCLYASGSSALNVCRLFLSLSCLSVAYNSIGLSCWLSDCMCNEPSVQARLGWRKPIHMRDIAVTEPSALGGRQLITVDKITSTQPLWSMLLRRGDFDLVLGRPCVDCSILPSGQSRLERLTQVAILGPVFCPMCQPGFVRCFHPVRAGDGSNCPSP